MSEADVVVPRLSVRADGVVALARLARATGRMLADRMRLRTGQTLAVDAGLVLR